MTTNKQPNIQELFIGLLSEGKVVEIPVYGLSMFPFFRPGVKVQVKSCKSADIHPGMILCFSNNGKLTLHRLIYKKDELFICKGDSLLKCDSETSISNIYGVVDSFYRKNKCVAMNSTLNKLYGWLMIRLYRITGYLFQYPSFIWAKLTNYQDTPIK